MPSGLPLNSDQGIADADQTASDADQTAAERDEADAASDQRVAELEQARADRHRHVDADAEALRSYESSRIARAATTISRLVTRVARSKTGLSRVVTAGERDATAAARDEAARRRDVAHGRSTAPSPPPTLRWLRSSNRSAPCRRGPRSRRRRPRQGRAGSSRCRARTLLLEAELKALTWTTSPEPSAADVAGRARP